VTTPSAEAHGFYNDFLDGGMTNLLAASTALLAARWHHRYKP